MDPLLHDIEPPEPLDKTGEESLLDTEITSARKSDDEDEGARVPTDDPTG